MALISAVSARTQAKDTIQRATNKINDAISGATGRGEFSVHVFLTLPEWHIVQPMIDEAGLQVKIGEQAGSSTFRYTISW